MIAYPEFRLPACFARAVPPEEAAALLDALQAEIECYGAEQATRAVEKTLVANFGLAMGRAIFADLTGTADAPNSVLVGGTVTRAAVSKAATRIRRGFGLPVRCPANARAGAARKSGNSGSAKSPAP